MGSSSEGEIRTVFGDGLQVQRGPKSVERTNGRKRAKGTDGGASGEQVESLAWFCKLEFRIRSTARVVCKGEVSVSGAAAAQSGLAFREAKTHKSLLPNWPNMPAPLGKFRCSAVSSLPARGESRQRASREEERDVSTHSTRHMPSRRGHDNSQYTIT